MNKITSAQDAIRQAIEGGYEVQQIASEYARFEFLRVLISTEASFWQALGKAREWTGEYCSSCKRQHAQANDCDAGFGDAVGGIYFLVRSLDEAVEAIEDAIKRLPNPNP